MFRQRFAQSIRKLRVLVAIAGVLVGSLTFISQDTAHALQFQNRTFYINSTNPSASTFYEFSLRFPGVTSVGSLKFQICDSALRELACNTPAGVDLSGATLGSQTGETGFSIYSQDASTIILTRTASNTAIGDATYHFDNVINPSVGNTSFYVRMDDYPTADASGAETDYGSAVASLNDEVGIATQVPPILIFCAGTTVNDDQCNDVSGDFTDIGELSATSTKTAQSQMLAQTNAQYGYNITANGPNISAGVNAIPSPSTPTPSLKGVGQFGINLVANTTPAIGLDPSGLGTNAVVSGNYAVPNKFMYKDGDVVASVNGVSMPRKFTVSYIVNVPSTQNPGIYSTTITYICLAGF